jgi:transposase
VPRLLRGRRPEDAEEERKVRKLAGSRHAPGDWIFRARIICRSWQGLRNAEIAKELGCHLKTVRKCIHRFNDEGMYGLRDRPRAGRKPRLTQPERSKIIALVAKTPPGKLLTEPDGVIRVEDETKPAYWTLDALADAAQEMGIEVGRSQVRRILLREGVRWRNTRPWAQSSYLRSSPQKVENCRALHRPASERHGGIRRRTRPYHSACLSSGSRMVAGRPPHQSASGVQP